MNLLIIKKIFSLIVVILLFGNIYCQSPSMQETEKFIEQSLEDYSWTEGPSINYVDFENVNGEKIMKIHNRWKILYYIDDYYEFNVKDLNNVFFEIKEGNILVYFLFKQNKFAKCYNPGLNETKKVNKFELYLSESAKYDKIPERLKKAFEHYLFLVTGEKKSTAF